jgi:hypothetical protein
VRKASRQHTFGKMAGFSVNIKFRFQLNFGARLTDFVSKVRHFAKRGNVLGKRKTTTAQPSLLLYLGMFYFYVFYHY